MDCLLQSNSPTFFWVSTSPFNVSLLVLTLSLQRAWDLCGHGETSLDFAAAPPLRTSENEFATLAGMKRHENPAWFHYPEVCYRDSLQCLPGCVLTSSAGRYVHKRDDMRTKECLWLNFSVGASSFLSCQMTYCSHNYPMSFCQTVVSGREALS